MAIQNATNVAIRVGGQGVGNTIGYATSASLSVNMDLRDSTTKSSGGWQENLGGLKSWEISGDAFVDVDADTFTEAIITSISIDAGVEENATYSISLTGTGALTQS